MTPRELAHALAAGAALTALALAGGVDGALAGLALLPAITAPLFRGVLAGRVALAGLALGGVAVLVWLGMGGPADEVIGAGLVLLLVQQRCAPADARTDRVVLLLGTLALVAGAGRATSPMWLLLWLTWALAVPVALGGVVPGSVGLTSLVSLASVAVAGVLFVTLPRLVGAGHPDASQALTGLADDVTLGDLATLRDDPTPVAEVRFLDGDPGAMVLRAAALEAFDGRRWSSAAPLRMAPVWASGPSRQVTVQHEPIDGAVLVPGAVVRFEAGGAALRQDVAEGWRTSAPGTVQYTAQVVTGTVLGPADLRPDERGRALALPPLDPRVTALALALTASAASDAERIAAVTAHVAGLRYARDDLPRTADPTSAFLFDVRAGHCEHFASAVAVLLRASGVPARVVTGFSGGEAMPAGGWRLRRQDAHAWTEAHVDGVGWVAIDATAPVSASAAATVEVLASEASWRMLPSPSAAMPPPLPAWSARVASRRIWADVLTYDRDDQRGVVLRLVDTLLRPTSVLALLVLVGIALLVRRRRLRARSVRRAAVVREGVIGHWDRVMTALHRAGVQAPPELPPVAASTWLAQRMGPGGAPLLRLGWLHAEVRFGGADDAHHRDEAALLADALIASLPECDLGDASGPIPENAPRVPTRRI